MTHHEQQQPDEQQDEQQQPDDIRQNREQSDGQRDGVLISHFGPLEIDWPRSIGYFGGILAAATLGIFEPPLAIFIAAVPFVKMLDHQNAWVPVRFTAEVLEGAAKPVGSVGKGTIRLKQQQAPSKSTATEAPRLSMLAEARKLANQRRARQDVAATQEQVQL